MVYKANPLATKQRPPDTRHYICPNAEKCSASLCGHRVPHHRDIDGLGDHCEQTPKWARHCPACELVYTPGDPRD